jgi:hypothetical protein
MDINTELMHLNEDFVYASRAVGKIIISEVFLPFERKVIQPITRGLGNLFSRLIYDSQYISFVDSHHSHFPFSSVFPQAVRQEGRSIWCMTFSSNSHWTPLGSLVDQISPLPKVMRKKREIKKYSVFVRERRL